MLLNAGNLLFEEQEADGDKYGFLELHVMIANDRQRPDGFIDKKSQIKSVEELSQFLDTCLHLNWTLSILPLYLYDNTYHALSAIST